jgi:hypothetical protein
LRRPRASQTYIAARVDRERRRKVIAARVVDKAFLKGSSAESVGGF